MKGKVFLSVVILIILVGGLFLPVKSAVDDQLQPESNPLTVFNEAEEEKQAQEEARAEEESKAEQEEMIKTLSDSEQAAYAWAALHSDPEFTLMTPERIAEYNAGLIKSCKMTDMFSEAAPTQEDVFAWMDKDQEKSSLEGEELEAAVKNTNREGVFHPLQYGVITTRTRARLLPSSEAGKSIAVRLIASTPVWVLHTSADFGWYYIQTTYGRGWVPAANVAIASSREVWLSYVQPESKAVVIRDFIKQEDFRLDMGSVFSCLEENGDSYTVLQCVAKKDGSLDSVTVDLARDDSSAGYVDYTWTHLYKQLYRYAETSAKNMPTNAEMIIHVYQSFGIQLPANLKSSFKKLGTVTELSDLSEDEFDNTLTALTAPSLIQDSEGIGFLLGRKDGKWYKFVVRDDGTAGEAVVNGAIRTVTIG